MSKPATQEDYVALCESIIKQTGSIDNETRWQEAEPEWWLMMMTMQRMARDHLNAMEVQS